MKAQIEKILSMARAGTITDEQAAQLIAELKSEPGAPRPARSRGLFGSVRDAIRVAAYTSDTDMFLSELRDNQLSMSSIGPVTGADYVFDRNALKMSAIKQLDLQRAEMTGNEVGTSQLEHVAVVDGKLADCTFHGSSVEHVTIDHSQLLEASVGASSFEHVSLRTDSRIDGLKVNASQLEHVELTASSWLGSEINASQASKLRLERSSLCDVQLNGAQVSDLELVDSRLSTTLFRGARVKHLTLTSSELEDVLVTGGDDWKKNGLDTVAFDRCTLRKALFSQCRFKNVTFRNVTLDEVKAMRVRLEDQVIDGNEAFLTAIGAEPARAQT